MHILGTKNPVRAKAYQLTTGLKYRTISKEGKKKSLEFWNPKGIRVRQ